MALNDLILRPAIEAYLAIFNNVPLPVRLLVLLSFGLMFFFAILRLVR